MSVGRFGSLALGRILDPIEATHRRSVRTWYRRVGAAGTPLERVHEGMLGTVYGAIRLGGATAGVITDRLVQPGHAAHDATRAVANGVWGDRPEIGDLALDMEIRDRSGRVVAPGSWTPDHPTDHLVILVHGLGLTDRTWDDGTHSGLASRIDDHPDLTCLRLRYNTGLPVAENGSLLADQLDALVSTWPVAVRSITLIGHSMGGLVVRAACADADADSWFDHVDHVVTLGTPHAGAPLARAVDVTGRALDVFPSTRPFAESIDRRSAGIRDLEHGTVTREPGTQRATAVLRSGPAYHFIAGVVTTDRAHPIGWAVGDLLVRANSATAGRLEPTSSPVIGGVHHMGVLSDPALADHVMALIEPGPPGGVPRQPTAVSKATPTP